MYLPLWWRALLLHLCEDTIRLVIYALRASRQLAIAFDLLLSTHVASLLLPPSGQYVSSGYPRPEPMMRR